jgi:hypothetical protein
MAKDEVEWDDAKLKFDEIEQANKAFMGLHTLPYKVRIGASHAKRCTCIDGEEG